jgi:3-methyladenine DNA glycosylase/8-oxoguanine DNA glycosylase
VAHLLRSTQPDHSQRFEFDFELAQGRSMGRTGGKGRLGTVVYDGPDLWRAEDLPSGPATLRIRRLGHLAEVDAWGPGLEEALAKVPGLLGASDEPSRLQPTDPVVSRWVAQHPTARLTRTGTIWEHLIPTITGQKVPGPNNKAAWQGILRTWGRTPAGDAHPDLRLAPDPDVIAGLADHDFHRFDLERKRAETLIEVGRRARRLEEAARMEPPAARQRLEAVRGVGPWSSAVVTLMAHGDPDAVITGDYWLPSYVAWHLAGERRADDRRMLELLEPYRGQRARVQGFAKAAGAPPRRGPRLALVDLSDR